MPDHRSQTVLVTGATGYVGSRLIATLLAQGHRVLAATRDAASLERFDWHEDVEPRLFDIEDDHLIRTAVTGADAVVYLVHSLDDEDFVAKDRAAAERVASACQQAGTERIVYLSGLVPPGRLSDHLRSRHQVEQVFLDSSVPSTVLRAAMVVGAGSTSYELLRRLSERIPLFTPVPAWMRRRLQPVAVTDVLYLVRRALEGQPLDAHFDVGGDEVMTYPELLGLFADVAGLTRVRVLVPLAPKWLVGRACSAISGMSMNEVESLVDSLSYDMVCHDRDATREALLDPDYRFTPLREAFERALAVPEEPGTSSAGDPLAAAVTDPA